MISKSTELKIVRSLTIDKEFYFQKYYKFWLRFRASVSLPPPGANDFDLSRNTKRCMMKSTQEGYIKISAVLRPRIFQVQGVLR